MQEDLRMREELKEIVRSGDEVEKRLEELYRSYGSKIKGLTMEAWAAR